MPFSPTSTKEKFMKKIVDCSLSVKSWDADGTFSGYASVFGITDAQEEQVASGAFDLSLKSWAEMGKMPKLLWQHDFRHPIGLWHEIREDSHGLFVKGQLLLDLTQGREAYSLLKNGIVDGLSIGFITVRSRRGSASRVRVLEEVNLQEVSLVTFAANPKAKVERVKMQEPEVEDLVHRLDQLGELLRRRGG
jgi:HK97 family phage prohead protease